MSEHIDIDLCDGGSDTDVYVMRWKDIPKPKQILLVCNGHMPFVTTNDPSMQIIRFGDKHVAGQEPTTWFGESIQ